ncbi:MAG: putative damage-inducible protein DinB [Mariniflexile sp.]|jgi:uncharacterized damage-inducible protein DinB
MTTQTLIKLFRRDLTKLSAEIELYNNEQDLWLLKNKINNAAGNLSLHIIGNLNHFIGSVLGKTGYIRQRDLEFSLKDIPKATLFKAIESTKVMVETVLSGLNEEDLKKDYPLMVFNETMTTEYFLTHLTTHLAYHLGQINYHRRLIK